MDKFNAATNDQALENRYTYHPPKGDQAKRYEDVRAWCLGLARFLVITVPASPELYRALDALDEVMMLANAAIARNE